MREKISSIVIQGSYAIVAILVALGFGAILIKEINLDPVAAYTALFVTPFISVAGLTSILSASSPLILTGLGVALAFKTGVWNIGAEGQMAAGALFAAAIGLDLSLPAPIEIFLIIVTGIVGGSALALVAAALKVKFNANEIVVTLMLNYAMLLVLQFVLQTAFVNRTAGFGGTETVPIAATAIFPELIQGTSLHAGVIISMICVPFLYLLVFRTTLGFKLRVVGSSRETAKYAGIHAPQIIIIAMALSGALAGLAGAGELAGVHHRLLLGITSGLGYTGVLVAVLGRLHPIAVTLAGVLFGWLIVGGEAMQSFAGVPSTIVVVLQGMVVIFVLLSDLRLLRRYISSVIRIRESE